MDKEIATKPLNLNLELNGIGIERGTKIENIRKEEDMAPGPATFILAHLLYLTLAAHLHSYPARHTHVLAPTNGPAQSVSVLWALHVVAARWDPRVGHSHAVPSPSVNPGPLVSLKPLSRALTAFH